MHALLATLTLLFLATSLGSAADKKDPPAQSQRMSECTTQAGDRKLTNDARKQFMTDCLKGTSTSADAVTGTAKTTRPHKSEEAGQGHTSQTEKMKTCNQEATAKNLHKEERRQFMSDCLKGDKKS